MKVATLRGLLLLVIAAGAFVSLAYHQDHDEDVETGCTRESLGDSILDCPTFVEPEHSQNCCTIKPSDCQLKYRNGTVACRGEGRFCPLDCPEDTVVQCGDVFYTDRCENCCTVEFSNCAIRHAGNGTIICQGIGFHPEGRVSKS